MEQDLDLSDITNSVRIFAEFQEFMEVYKNLDSPELRAKVRATSISFLNKFNKDKVYVSEHGTFDKIFISSAPYHHFLSSVSKVKSFCDEPYSVAFHEIIDWTTGEIVDSLHINFTVELLWIISEYMLAAQNLKMTILYSTCKGYDRLQESEMEFHIPFDIKKVQIKPLKTKKNPLKIVHGCHRSKISIFKYVDNKIRIVISNANMTASDWQHRTHEIWISPFLPLLPETAEDTDGDSPTKFKKDFLKYLYQYKNQEVFEWQVLIRRADCSAINVFFIASVPGYFEGPEMYEWGYKKLDAILAAYASLPEDAQKWSIVCQSSEVGYYAKDYHSWLSSQIIAPMSRAKDKRVVFLPEFKFIYPTEKNYSISYDAEYGTTSLMYSESIYLKQKWLKDYSYQWKADKVNRTQALPCPSYARVSPDETEISWFILTSANVDKNCWGTIREGTKILTLHNYEAGVVFIPQFMINKTTFPIKSSVSSEVPVFLLPFDLPLTRYEEDDEPSVHSPQKNLTEKEPETVNIKTESPTNLFAYKLLMQKLNNE